MIKLQVINNAVRDKIVANEHNGKLSFYELDLHKEK